MNINWKVFTNTNNEEKTKKLINKLLKNIESEAENLEIQKYYKGGFVSVFTIPLISSQWSNVILESLSKAQTVGRGWIITGQIENELEAWSNDSVISGVQNIEVFVEKKH